ncbi:MAG: universal stress protein [Deltaproteobacteria bacterium]|nr:universal stress protein [Deltaproteobacteria bacterium]
MRILLCYDETKEAAKALETAIEHAKAFNGEVLILTSLVGKGKEKVEEDREAKQRLEKARAYLKEAGIPCESHLLVRGLDSGESIVNFSKENGVGEIIIGVKKKSKVGKLMFGSTAQHVILHAECTVVAVK